MVDGHYVKRALDVHEMLARVYADTRFGPARNIGLAGCDLRTFAVTVIWVVGAERVPHGQRIARVCEVLHLDEHRFRQVIRADAPRYEPARWQWQGGVCEAPMIRRDGPCGRPASTAFRVTDPADGTWRKAGYCARHRDEASAAHRAERARQQAGLLPEPLPNTGGLLPCYIRWNWEKNYALADPTWKPPRVGICADNWPVMAKVTAAEPPGLTGLDGGGETDTGHPAPSLRLIT